MVGMNCQCFTSGHTCEGLSRSELVSENVPKGLSWLIHSERHMLIWGRGTLVTEHPGTALAQWLPTSQLESERQCCDLEHQVAVRKIELLQSL